MTKKRSELSRILGETFEKAADQISARLNALASGVKKKAGEASAVQG
jgi:hypothetical protein